MASPTTDQFPPGYLQENRQPAMYTITGLFMILDTVTVALRFVSRRIGGIRWNRDDILIIVGWIFVMCFNSVVMADVRYGGVGLHQAYVMMVDPDILVFWAKDLVVISFIYIVAIVPPKLAVLSLYLSIFGSQRAVSSICYVTATLIIANGLGSIIAASQICVPLNYLWNKEISGHCFDINACFRWVRLVNVLSDVVILVLPIPYVLRLHVSIRLKIGLLITFLLGSLGFVAAIICWIEYFKTNAVSDNTWSASTILIWSVVEVGMYLIATCLLSYQPLVKVLWRKTRWGQRSSVESAAQRHISSKVPSRSQYRLSGRSTRLKDDEDSIGLVTIAQHRPRSNDHQVEAPGEISVEHQITID